MPRPSAGSWSMPASGSTRRKLQPTRPDRAWRRSEGPPLASNTAGGTTQPAPEDPSLEGTARPAVSLGPARPIHAPFVTQSTLTGVSVPLSWSQARMTSSSGASTRRSPSSFSAIAIQPSGSDRAARSAAPRSPERCDWRSGPSSVVGRVPDQMERPRVPGRRDLTAVLPDQAPTVRLGQPPAQPGLDRGDARRMRGMPLVCLHRYRRRPPRSAPRPPPTRERS